MMPEYVAEVVRGNTLMRTPPYARLQEALADGITLSAISDRVSLIATNGTRERVIADIVSHDETQYLISPDALPEEVREIRSLFSAAKVGQNA